MNCLNSKKLEDIDHYYNKILLDRSEVIKYALILKENILNDKKKITESIYALEKLLNHIVITQDFHDYSLVIFDNKIIYTLFSYIHFGISLNEYYSTLKILYLLISGKIFNDNSKKNNVYIDFLENLIKSDQFFKIMYDFFSKETKIQTLIIKFITEVLKNSLKFNYESVIFIIIEIKKSFIFFEIEKNDNSGDVYMMNLINELRNHYSNLLAYLITIKFDILISSHTKLLNLLVSQLEFTTKSLESSYKFNFVEDPKKYFLENYKILEAINTHIFLSNLTQNFKNQYYESVCKVSHKQFFPIIFFCIKISNLCSDFFLNKKKHPQLYELIFYWDSIFKYFMESCLILWKEMNIEVQDDFQIACLIDLLVLDFMRLEKKVQYDKQSISDYFNVNQSNLYKLLRDQEMNFKKNLYFSFWDYRVEGFMNVLTKQVFDFVLEQRVIELLKGSWFYIKEFSKKKHKTSSHDENHNNKFFFICLSPNRQFICYKKFLEIPAKNPSIEELTLESIQCSQMEDFKCDKVEQKNSEKYLSINSDFISIEGNTTHEKITIIGKNNQTLLSFYVDSKIKRDIWMDGLNMLKGVTDFEQLSDSIKKQIKDLINLRKNTQMLRINDDFIKNDKHNNQILITNDQEYYRSEILNKISRNI